MRNGYWYSVLAVLSIALQACTPQTMEVPVKIGSFVDRGVGFCAYTTPLSETNPEDVEVTLRPRAAIEGRIVVCSPKAEFVYPQVAYDPPRVFAMPDSLGAATGMPIGRETSTDSVFQLGYIDALLIPTAEPYRYLENMHDSGIGGLRWGVLRSADARKVLSKLHEIREFVAGYGADAVTDVAVYFSEIPTSTNSKGIYIAGNVVAFIEAPSGEHVQPTSVLKVYY